MAARLATYENLVRGVNHFVEKTQPFMQAKTLMPLEVDLQISGFRVTGHLENVSSDRLMQYRYTRVKVRDRIRIWIYHLALNCLRDDAYPRVSMFAGLDPSDKRRTVWAAWEYLQVENSEDLLGELLEQYWQGLRNPLHFFPESSFTYASRHIQKNQKTGVCLNMANQKWTGSDFGRGESDDPYYQLCFRDRSPIDDDFRQIAEIFFSPIFKHCIELFI